MEDLESNTLLAEYVTVNLHLARYHEHVNITKYVYDKKDEHFKRVHVFIYVFI